MYRMTMRIAYTIDTEFKNSNLIAVELDIEDLQEEWVDIILPTWAPGSYVIRDYSRNVRNFHAMGGDGTELFFSKRDKSRWRIMCSGCSAVRISYMVFTSDLIPQASSVDDSHVYVLGASTLVYVDGYADQSVELQVRKKPEEKVYTNLEPIGEGFYGAPNYDVLADSIFEIGNPLVRTFSVQDKRHELVFCGIPDEYADPIAEICQKVVTYVTSMFSFLPYRRYVFFLHGVDGKGGGGHEHSNCCSITVGLDAIREGGANEVASVMAHEFFHTYNVKRIKPAEFESFDYTKENYTTLLWFSEGFTSFYTNIILYRSGVIDREKFLGLLGEQVRHYVMSPGKGEVSSSQSSFDAWIRLYKPSPDDFNTYISYYLKGAMLALVLDIMIILHTGGKSTLDNLMLSMWEKYKKDGKGFTIKDILRLSRDRFDMDLEGFVSSYIDGNDPLPVLEYLERLGYHVHVSGEDDGSTTGLLMRENAGRLLVVSAVRGYPCFGSGISPGDRVIAFNGTVFTMSNMRPFMGKGASAILMDYYDNVRAGDMVELKIERRGSQRTYRVQSTAFRGGSYIIRPNDDPPGAKYTTLLEMGQL